MKDYKRAFKYIDNLLEVGGDKQYPLVVEYLQTIQESLNRSENLENALEILKNKLIDHFQMELQKVYYLSTEEYKYFIVLQMSNDEEYFIEITEDEYKMLKKVDF